MVIEKSRALYDQVYEILREGIINLKYHPGSFLTEASVAEELQVSRMPVRVAIRKLENEGWLIADFRKKIKVRDITAKDVKEIYQLRKILEITALRTIFEKNLTWEYSFKLEEIVVRIRAAQNDPYQWELHDTEFHMEIVKVLDNERINRIYKNNQDELIRIGIFCEKPQGHVQDIIDGLYEFIKGMRDKNYDKAFDILNREHIIAGEDMAIAKLSRPVAKAN